MSEEENQEKRDRDRKRMLAFQKAKFTWRPGDIQIISSPKKGKGRPDFRDEERRDAEEET